MVTSPRAQPEGKYKRELTEGWMRFDGYDGYSFLFFLETVHLSRILAEICDVFFLSQGKNVTFYP